MAREMIKSLGATQLLNQLLTLAVLSEGDMNRDEILLIDKFYLNC